MNEKITFYEVKILTLISFEDSVNISYFCHRRETSRLPGVWQEVQLNLEPEDPPATALGLQAVQVRQVQGLLHPVRPPQVASPPSQQRAALYLLGLRQVLHQRFRTSHTLEDGPDLQTQRGRSGDQCGTGSG